MDIINKNQSKIPRNIWEIEDGYFCPVAGYCLSKKEQKHIYKKFSKDLGCTLGSINLHEFLVVGIQSDGPVARRVQRFLVSKYAKEIAIYSDVSFSEWLSLAESMCNPENYGAYIW